MITSLSAKNKLGMVNGKFPQPESNNPYFQFWERCDHMVKAWITNSFVRDIAISVMCLPSAREVQKDINDRFGQSNGSRYIHIQKEINSTVQGSSSISAYFTKMRSLWDELNASYVGPVCTCGALSKFIQDQQLFQFLSGLNETYNTVRSNTLMTEPLPSISKVYGLLQQDESQKETQPGLSNFSSDSVSFHASMSSPSSNSKPYNQKVSFNPNKNSAVSISCRYCKKPGHTIETYYRLHGGLLLVFK